MVSLAHHWFMTPNSNTGCNVEVKTISDWLSQNNWYSYHQDLTERRTENTGMWFVTGDEFQRWQRDEKARFWVTGMRECPPATLLSYC